MLGLKFLGYPYPCAAAFLGTVGPQQFIFMEQLSVSHLAQVSNVNNVPPFIISRATLLRLLTVALFNSSFFVGVFFFIFTPYQILGYPYPCAAAFLGTVGPQQFICREQLAVSQLAQVSNVNNVPPFIISRSTLLRLLTVALFNSIFFVSVFFFMFTPYQILGYPYPCAAACLGTVGPQQAISSVQLAVPQLTHVLNVNNVPPFIISRSALLRLLTVVLFNSSFFVGVFFFIFTPYQILGYPYPCAAAFLGTVGPQQFICREQLAVSQLAQVSNVNNVPPFIISRSTLLRLLTVALFNSIFFVSVFFFMFTPYQILGYPYPCAAACLGTVGPQQAISSVQLAVPQLTHVLNVNNVPPFIISRSALLRLLTVVLFNSSFFVGLFFFMLTPSGYYTTKPGPNIPILKKNRKKITGRPEKSGIQYNTTRRKNE